MGAPSDPVLPKDDSCSWIRRRSAQNVGKSLYCVEQDNMIIVTNTKKISLDSPLMFLDVSDLKDYFKFLLAVSYNVPQLPDVLAKPKCTGGRSRRESRRAQPVATVRLRATQTFIRLEV